MDSQKEWAEQKKQKQNKKHPTQIMAKMFHFDKKKKVHLHIQKSQQIQTKIDIHKEIHS